MRRKRESLNGGMLSWWQNYFGQPHYAASQPPSTARMWPVSHAAAGDARNSAAPTTSSGTPMRLITSRSRLLRTYSGSASRAAISSVRSAPGEMPLTRTPRITPLQHQRARQVDHAGLAGVVRGRLVDVAPDVAVDRADVDDAAAALPQHDRAGGLAADERAGQVHADNPIPLLQAQLLGRLGDVDPGVVHEHIERARRLERQVAQRLHLLRVGDVAAGRDGRAAALSIVARMSSSATSVISQVGLVAKPHHSGAGSAAFTKVADPPNGELWSTQQQAWWESLELPSVERLRARQDLATIQHLTNQLGEVEAELAHLSMQEPWAEQMPFLLQLPGIALITAMTVRSAIGDIRRFPSAKRLVGYSGLGRRSTPRARLTGRAASRRSGAASSVRSWWRQPTRPPKPHRSGTSDLSSWPCGLGSPRRRLPWRVSCWC